MPTPACPWTMHGGRWLWGRGGCREGSWGARLGFFGRSAGAGAALMNPVYFFFSPSSSFCADAGESTRYLGKGEAAPPRLLTRIPPGKRHWVTSPQRDALGLSLLLPLGSPNVQDFPPKTDLSFSLFLLSPPFLAVTLSSLCHLRLARRIAGNLRSLPQLPYSKCQILVGFCFAEIKWSNSTTKGSRQPKTSNIMSKPPFLFCTKSSCHCLGHGK